MTYAIEIRGSCRGSGNDDLWTGWDAGSLADARAELDTWAEKDAGRASPTWGPGDHAYIVGPDGVVLHHEVKPGRPADDDDLASGEFAMQQGMAFGVVAYNEAGGF